MIVVYLRDGNTGISLSETISATILYSFQLQLCEIGCVIEIGEIGPCSIAPMLLHCLRRLLEYSGMGGNEEKNENE